MQHERLGISYPSSTKPWLGLGSTWLGKENMAQEHIYALYHVLPFWIARFPKESWEVYNIQNDTTRYRKNQKIQTKKHRKHHSHPFTLFEMQPRHVFLDPLFPLFHGKLVVRARMENMVGDSWFPGAKALIFLQDVECMLSWCTSILWDLKNLLDKQCMCSCNVTQYRSMIPNEISIRLLSLMVSLPRFSPSLVPLPGSAVDCPIAILAWDVVVVVHLDHLSHPGATNRQRILINMEAFSLYVANCDVTSVALAVSAWLFSLPISAQKPGFGCTFCISRLPTSRIARSCVGPAPGGTSKPNSRMRRISPASASESREAVINVIKHETSWNICE